MKNSINSLIVVAGLAVSAILSSCGSEPTAPPAFRTSLFPAAPTKVSAVVDSNVIRLTWSYDNSTPIARFNIYRQNSGATASLVGTSVEHQFDDNKNLLENREYGYNVSAVLADGIEGPRSETITTVFAPGGLASDVFLLTPVALDTFPVSVQLSWAASTDSNNFAAYQVYRATTSDVNFNATSVANITVRTKLSFVDSGLQSGTTYYYRLFVFNRAGRFSASNVVMATTPVDKLPAAITLAAPSFLDTQGLRLTWARSRENDFASYRVFRSTLSPVSSSALPLTIINDAATTTYDDRGLTAGVVYYYVIAVYDRAGQFVMSNEVSGRIQ